MEGKKSIKFQMYLFTFTFKKHPVETCKMEEICQHPADASDDDENIRQVMSQL